MATMKTPRHPRWLFASMVAAILAALVAPGVATIAQYESGTPTAEADATTRSADLQASDLPAVEALVSASVAPETALSYIAVTVDSASDQWGQAEDLIRRAGLGDLLDQATAEIAPVAPTDDYSVFLTGEIALVVTSLDLFIELAEAGAISDDGAVTADETPTPAEEAEPFGFAAVIAPRDPDAAEALALEIATETAEQSGVTLDEIEIGGETVTVLPEGDFSDGAAFVRLDDLLVVAATAADLTPFVEVATGDASSLADSSAFTDVRAELPNDFLVYGYSNGPAVLEALDEILASLAESGTVAPNAFDPEQLLDTAQVYSGFTLWADDPGFRADTIAIPVDGTTLPTIPDNFDATLDERVPGDTLLFVNGYDYGPTIDPVLEMIGTLIADLSEDPTFPFPLPIPDDATPEDRARAIYRFAARFLTFNPWGDLLGNLVGEWGLALSVDPDDPTLFSGVIVSGVENEARLNDSLSKLAVWINLIAIGIVASSEGGEQVLLGEEPFGASVEEVNGALTQVIQIPIPELDATVRLQWGIVDGELVFGLGDGFATYIAGPASTLADNPTYQSAMGELPAEYFAAVYVDLATLIEQATPIVEEWLRSADPELTEGVTTVELPDLSGIQAIAAVGFWRENNIGTSAILLIAQ